MSGNDADIDLIEAGKKNIKPIKNPLEKVLQMQGVEYTSTRRNEKHAGLLSESVASVFPRGVIDIPVGEKPVDTFSLGAILVEAIKN